VGVEREGTRKKGKYSGPLEHQNSAEQEAVPLLLSVTTREAKGLNGGLTERARKASYSSMKNVAVDEGHPATHNAR